MRKEDFNALPNFTYNEVYNHYISKGFSPAAADKEIRLTKKGLFVKLQRFRTAIGRPIYFNCLNEGKHSKSSQHYEKNAADIRIGGKGAIRWNTMCEIAIDCGFKGIGYYPFWNKPGLHLDDRKTGFQMWVRDKAGKYIGFI